MGQPAVGEDVGCGGKRTPAPVAATQAPVQGGLSCEGGALEAIGMVKAVVRGGNGAAAAVRPLVGRRNTALPPIVTASAAGHALTPITWSQSALCRALKAFRHSASTVGSRRASPRGETTSLTTTTTATFSTSALNTAAATGDSVAVRHASLLQSSALVDDASAKLGRNVGAQLTAFNRGGVMLSWGLREWRLGRNTGEASFPLPALHDLTVTSVSGSRHSLVATAAGEVWSMGHNDSRGGGGHGSPPLDASGQLGRSEGDARPGRVGGPLAGKYVVQVAAGRYHSMAVTDGGQLYTWGLNDHGQLGRPAGTDE